MCFLYFQRVTLLILFCNQFSKEILQVHHSVFQCCCSSKNIQDLVCEMNTFQTQTQSQRLLFTTCKLDNISSAAYSLSFIWFACCILVITNSSLHTYSGPSINGLVTGGNTKLCCCVFVLALLKVLQPIKLICNVPQIIQSYSRYAKLKYYKFW